MVSSLAANKSRLKFQSHMICLTVAAVPTQLSKEAVGSSRHVIERPIKEERNNLLE